MDIITGDLREKVAQIIANEKAGNCYVTKHMAAVSDFYKVQDEYYGGNGTFFNSKAVNRFSLKDKSKGVMYVAMTPHTALKEVFKDDEVIGKQDFNENCMAIIQAEREIKLFDLTALAPLLKIPVGDLMGPETVYEDTQFLAQVLSEFADGIEYLSRHTGKPCIALWSGYEDGGEMLKTVSVTPLCDYSHDGKSCKQILKSQLGIHVM
jgi:hypothetical protein